MKKTVKSIMAVLLLMGMLWSCSNPSGRISESLEVVEGNEEGGRAVSHYSYSKIKSVMSKKGYKFFTGEMNINIIAIRDRSRKANSWDDLLCVVYQQGGKNKVRYFDSFTTDPGSYYLQHPVNSLGCAIVAPGQYRGVFKIGYHKGKYKALVQRSNITVYRDNNKNTTLNLSGRRYSGMYGINLHHGYNSSTVGKNSAGCQVLKSPSALTALLKICEASSRKYGNSFTYTVLNEADF